MSLDILDGSHAHVSAPVPALESIFAYTRIRLHSYAQVRTCAPSHMSSSHMQHECEIADKHGQNVSLETYIYIIYIYTTYKHTLLPSRACARMLRYVRTDIYIYI